MYRISGVILTGIVAAIVMGIPLGIATLSDTFAKIPNASSWGNIVFCFDFKGLSSLQAIIYVFIAFCGNLFSTLETVLGVADEVGMLDEDGNMPGIQEPFLVDAIGTYIGACTGSTTIIAFVESTLDMETGDRTGLTSIVVVILSVVMVFSSPLILMVPDAATGPTLIFVGSLIVSGVRNVDFSDSTEAFGPFIMTMFVIFCGSIAAEVATDILAYIVVKTATGKFKELHPVIYVLAVPLIMYFVFK